MKIVDAGYEILDPLNGEEILKKIERVPVVFDDLEPMEWETVK